MFTGEFFCITAPTGYPGGQFCIAKLCSPSACEHTIKRAGQQRQGLTMAEYNQRRAAIMALPAAQAATRRFFGL